MYIFLDIFFLNITTIISAQSAKIKGIWDISFRNKLLAWMDSSVCVSYNGAILSENIDHQLCYIHFYAR